MHTIQEVCTYLESIAPLSLQENYDNCGLQTGNAANVVTGILISLDINEAVLDEAIAKGCNLIIGHHPVIFKGIKKLTGKSETERILIKAIENKLALYAIHTNLDNISEGVNQAFAKRLGLEKTEILLPKSGELMQLVTYVPTNHAEALREALFETGAGQIGNYDQCSFNISGKGSFRAKNEAKPFVGEIGKRHEEEEVRVEMVFPTHLESKLIGALKQAHPYEEVAYQTYHLGNTNKEIGSGMQGVLPEPMSELDFLGYLKEKMELSCIRHSPLMGKKIHKIGICGGAGSFLSGVAKGKGLDAFVSADFKYHEFFEADSRLLIADIGHYESEKYTKDWIRDLIIKKFAKFAVLLSQINTNPVNYYS